jgi:hypothetical protein
MFYTRKDKEKYEDLQKYSNALELEYDKIKKKSYGYNYNGEKSLQEYSKEIGLDYVLSVEELIDSHRNLRNSNIKNLTEFRAVSEEYRKRGYEEGYVNVINREFISFENLKKMNVKEFADHLCDY